MLEGIQQAYPGVGGAYPPSMIPQTGFNTPLAGVMGSGVQGLFGNAGFGRPVDPITQAYLQQVQIAQQLAQQGSGNLFGNQPQQWGQQTPYDPITALYLQQVVRQLAGHQGHQGFYGGQAGMFGNPLQYLLQNPLQNIGQMGRPYGLDPITIALLQQQIQQSQQFGQRLPFQTPFQGHVGAGTYGPLGAWT